MKLRYLDEGFAALLLALGVYIVWSALVYGYMADGIPGPGFFPFWAGLLLAGLSLINLVRSAWGRAILDGRIQRDHLGMTLAMILAVALFLLAVPYLGMVVGIFFLMFAIGYAVEDKANRTRSFAAKLFVTSIALAAGLYALFGLTLHVPLVTGLFGI